MIYFGQQNMANNKLAVRISWAKFKKL